MSIDEKNSHWNIISNQIKTCKTFRCSKVENHNCEGKKLDMTSKQFCVYFGIFCILLFAVKSVIILKKKQAFLLDQPSYIILFIEVSWVFLSMNLFQNVTIYPSPFIRLTCHEINQPISVVIPIWVSIYIVKVVEFGRYKGSTQSHNKLSYVLKWCSELWERRDLWSLGHSTVNIWINPFPEQWLVAGSGM